ncbi:hypothetical protein ATE84_3993 [Aquimarina sp. MAR_2010_214]|uniref:hypothetical protein n=1 Tax=Aquimarina sp. MAR_2010_214 TaxID=1250026 RepID=UPI000C711B1F|nr:hypothetical protein [Aquimarina sp. MAR_2010_214]PKV51893.1 hypothetical protein ATE84_3993 [Aquimarina sp. MAR_2010_214]
MRKIKITDDLRKNVKTFNDNLFINTRTKGFEIPINRLNSFLKIIKPRKHKQYKLYVEKIIDEYEDILNADPLKMEKLILEFDAVLHNSQLNSKITSRRFSFHEKVVEAMRYEDLRAKEFPDYLLNSNLKTCVYCNAQSTLVIEKKFYDKKKRRAKQILAKLQLDHYYPKSKYPFLCTSFFNLYPTCANCNLAKGSKEALFELYTTTNDLDLFNFKIDDKSILDYLIKFELNHLKVDLESMTGDFTLLKNHNELFQIEAVYESYKDVAEELVLKAKANPHSYRSTLEKNYSKLFPDPTIIDRLLVGNYTKPEELGKRPLSKYTQDIARQLKIIK